MIQIDDKGDYYRGYYKTQGVIKNDRQLRKAWERLCEYAEIGCFENTTCVIMAKVEIRAYNKSREVRK